MDHQPSPKQNQSNSSEAPTQPIPQELVNPIETLKKRQETAQHNTEKNPLSDRPKWTDVAIVILTAGICYFAFVQSREMINSGVQTDKVIAADERLATAMEDSVAQAKRGLDASIEVSRSDQRAWIGITGIQILSLAAGNKISLQVPYTNSGKTIALDVRTRSFVTISDTAVKVSDFLATQNKVAFNKPLAVFPSIAAQNISLVSPLPASEADVSAIKEGRKFMYALGEMRYKDIFDRMHYTQFCGRYLPKTSTMEFCDEYNGAN